MCLYILIYFFYFYIIFPYLTRTYVDATDGSNRTRVRFNVKGPKGQALVWAEVCIYMYVMCLFYNGINLLYT